MGNAASGMTTAMSAEAQLKAYRQLERELEVLAGEGVVDEATIFKRLQAKHAELRDLYELKTFKCPTVRFGRTELQVTCCRLSVEIFS